jgi:hypothetical protein
MVGNSEAASQVARDPPSSGRHVHALMVRYDTLSHEWESPHERSRFSQIALSVEECAHVGLPAFRVGARKFASLASQAGGYGSLMHTLEQQAAFVEEAPEIFLPIPGGWGKMGHTHVHLAASEDVLTGALRTASKLRIDKNARTSRRKTRCGEVVINVPLKAVWGIQHGSHENPGVSSVCRQSRSGACQRF